MAARDIAPVLPVKKAYEDVLTPHNICVVLLLRSYRDIREYNPQVFDMPGRKSFVLLTEKLLVNPGMKYHEFLEFLQSDNEFSSEVIKQHMEHMEHVANGGADEFVNYMQASRDCVFRGRKTLAMSKCSPAGVFIRKVVVMVELLSFHELVKEFHKFREYYYASAHLLADFPIKNVKEDNDDKEMVSEIAPKELTSPMLRLFDVHNELWKKSDDNARVWSRKQAQHYLMTTVTRLMYNEVDDGDDNLKPEVVRKHAYEILQSNPEFVESYYLLYLNCLRTMDYNGALDNLHKYFDGRCVAFKDDVGFYRYRYAALNLAMFYAYFDNKESALKSLNECIILSHLVGDTPTLHLSQAWLRYIQDENTEENINEAISKWEELTNTEICTINLQTLAKRLALQGADIESAFQLFQRSEMVNSQSEISDYTLLVFACKAAIWETLGSQTVCNYLSQILLSINPASMLTTLKEYNVEPVCIAICNIAWYALNQGYYSYVNLLLRLAKKKFPQRHSKWWLLVEQVYYFEDSLNNGNWHIAQSCVTQIAAIDKEESVLRSAQLYLVKGDKAEAYNEANQLIKEKPDLSNIKLLRAYLIMARALGTGAMPILLKAYSLALEFKLSYVIALIKMEMSKVQLKAGFPTEALNLLRQCSVIIFSERKLIDHADYLVVLAKCKIKLAQKGCPEDKKVNIEAAISYLDIAKRYYQELGSLYKVKDIAYLQALLAHDIDDENARNKFAYEFRKYDEDTSISFSSTSNDIINMY